MATYVTPKINTIYIFYISLVSQANTKIFQANPTIAAGDFLVATDDGAPGNLGTLPVVDADFTKRLKVTLSAAEMNGGNVTFIASDAAGAEWCDLTINIQTTARQIDDLAFPVTSGRGLDVTATGAAGVDWGNVENPTTANGLTGTTIATTQKVDIETIKTNPVVNAGTVTFPTTATLASTTNITGGTIATVTNLTNLPAAAALEATLTDMKGATFTGATDSLEAIRDRGDAAWITATGFATSGQATAIQADTDDLQVTAAAILVDTGTTLDTAITAIKTQTDKLAFTVANQVDANIQSVNDVTVTGTGAAGTEWGP